MTNSINQPNQKYQSMYPANYSGVTINVTNPSLTSVPHISAYQGQNQVLPVQTIPNYQNTQSIYQAPATKQQQISYPSDYYINNYNNQPQVYPLTQNQQDYMLPQQNTYNPQQYYDYQEQQNRLNTSNEIVNQLNTISAEEKQKQKNGVKKQITILTNEYIMSVENFLNNPNKDIRRKGAKEVINRLGEDANRKDDAALNALLNKMLQDPDKGVRTLALSAFASGLATGNNFTVKLLKNMEANPSLYPEDMDQVMSALLNMTTGTETIYVEATKK